MKHDETILIRSATLDDAAGIAAIYNHYVTDTIVTFEEDPVTADEIARRINEVLAASLPWLVAVDGTRIVGYAYATPWKRRFGYRFSAETTVYLDRQETGRGIGSKLYAALFPLLTARGIRCAIGGIALPNPPSVALHERFGMTKVAEFPEVGVKFDEWINVGYWAMRLPEQEPGSS